MQFINTNRESSRSRLGCPNRETAIIEHIKTVRMLARRLQSRLPVCVTYDDLVSAGTIGLIQAVDRFQVSRGLKFTAFARHRILGAMLDFLRDEDPVSRTERQRIRSSQASPASVGVPLTLSLDSMPVPERVTSEPFQLRNQGARAISHLDIRNARMHLSARENYVISLLYEQGWRNREVAEKLHVNESRISQIKHAALAKLEARLQ
jgi:RNA polymerase sigma factor for flagellar operon FliA